MKKQNIINLVRYYTEKNDEAFASEVVEIAKSFDKMGDSSVADYLMELVSNVNYYVPQTTIRNMKFLRKIDFSNKPLYLPEAIEEDVLGVARAIKNNSGLSKFLFYGQPGSGKTQSTYQIARILDREILSVDFEELVDSRLGETSKNVKRLFDEIERLPYKSVIILFDEIDALVLDRINSNDLREMGRVTSVFLKRLDELNEKFALIATTNLHSSLDKALLRRFDATISFDRYEKDDLIQVSNLMLEEYIGRFTSCRKDSRLFNKMLKNLDFIPYPGIMLQIIKKSIAFSDETMEYDYLRKIFMALDGHSGEGDIPMLKDEGYTVREIEILTKVPKSSVSRKLKER